MQNTFVVKVKVKFPYKPSGSSGRSLSRFPQHEATESISTPPWMGCQSIAGLPPSIKFASTHLYTWVERGTVRVKCLAQEHNMMSLASARTRTAQFRDKSTNHEAIAPPTFVIKQLGKFQKFSRRDKKLVGYQLKSPGYTENGNPFFCLFPSIILFVHVRLSQE